MTEWGRYAEDGFMEWAAEAGLFRLYVCAEREEDGGWHMYWLLHLADDHSFQRSEWQAVDFNDIPRRAPLLAGDCLRAAEQAWRETGLALEGLRS